MKNTFNFVQESSSIKVLIIDDTVEGKRGKCIEGSRDALWSNKEKRNIRAINVVSLDCSDGYSSFMLNFAIAMGNMQAMNNNNRAYGFSVCCLKGCALMMNYGTNF